MKDLIKNTDVYILCGGLGKRLRPVIKNIPKPLARIADRPLLDIIIGRLSGFGFTRFILGVGYRSEFFKKHYRNPVVKGLKIIFCEEKTPLGTGGAVKKAKSLIISNPFFVLNGDSFCEFDPLNFLKFHKKKKAVVSILLKKVSSGAEYGRVKLNKAGRILDFSEKNSLVRNCLVNAGVYLFDKKAFDIMPKKKAFSLELDFFPNLTEKQCFGYAGSGSFIDIGTPERYSKASNYFLSNKKWKKLIF
ncbi:MAG: hypothetical protein AUJ74_06325 [Candidatus Omnitrophica bacterium CG1_02_44_16]|nr:MAG: hypothetical protein AUJ74_06325 [Candidatus Omnitrophica bacterium CG1_02_44_16]PIY83016.1 MAG: hypothetical protein COY78_03495 [Candidatus Omnitrophica bacterium CG_4_10_14_0_8_um_filter_44_12]PIZ83585.1 MAG: hypothetical protein COX96_07330 [Candidatus Omnitrophica bacterium CG_4_10_14_0_2_um_filter_44_9]